MSRSGESLFALLVRAHAVAQALAADLLFECGVSVTEAWVLEEIPTSADRCATQIARALGVPTSTVTRALRRLETCSYVSLAKGTFLGARVLRPALTEMGESTRKHVAGFEHELDRMLFRDLRPLELGAFVVGLTRLANHPRAALPRRRGRNLADRLRTSMRFVAAQTPTSESEGSAGVSCCRAKRSMQRQRFLLRLLASQQKLRVAGCESSGTVCAATPPSGLLCLRTGPVLADVTGSRARSSLIQGSCDCNVEKRSRR
jgi:DNA-binding MarR family transcriptional regulator